MASTLSWNKGPALAERLSHITISAAQQRQNNLPVACCLSCQECEIQFCNAWELTGDHHIHFHYRGKMKGEFKFKSFKWKSIWQGESVCPAPGDQRTSLVVDLSVLSVSHLAEEIIKTRTKLQLKRLLLLSHLPRKSLTWFLFFPRIEHLCSYTASQKMSENLQTAWQRIQPNCCQKNFCLFLTRVGVAHHKNSYYNTAYCTFP